jgi:hypothetical protein
MLEELKRKVAVLKEVQIQYGGLTIDNIIQQLESRIKHHERKK